MASIPVDRSTKQHLPTAVVALMAAGTGISVANLYYCQPLLRVIGHEFQTPDRYLGWLPALTQAGSAVGMFLFVPLGDIVERRTLTWRMCVAVAAIMLTSAWAPRFGVLLAISFLLGVACNIPHLILPYAAQLAPDRERGRIVGTIISGLLVGILLARAVSGFLGSYFGWRSVYLLGGVLMLTLALLIRRNLPPCLPSVRLSYPALLRSLPRLFIDHSLLREAAGTGAMTFGAFQAFWTTLVLLLQQPPLHYGEKTAGLFGLVGASGAVVAPAVGRLMDRHPPRVGVLYGILCSLAGFIVLWLAGSTLWGIAAGVVLMDIGVQTAHVSNQSRIYRAFPNARSRVNTLYMVSYFAGGSAGSILASWAWHYHQWPGVCFIAIGLLSIGLTIHMASRVRDAEGNIKKDL